MKYSGIHKEQELLSNTEGLGTTQGHRRNRNYSGIQKEYEILRDTRGIGTTQQYRRIMNYSARDTGGTTSTKNPFWSLEIFTTK